MDAIRQSGHVLFLPEPLVLLSPSSRFLCWLWGLLWFRLLLDRLLSGLLWRLLLLPLLPLLSVLRNLIELLIGRAKLSLRTHHSLLGFDNLIRVSFFVCLAILTFSLLQSQISSLSNLMNQILLAFLDDRMILLVLIRILLRHSDSFFTHLFSGFPLSSLLMLLIAELVDSLLNFIRVTFQFIITATFLLASFFSRRAAILWGSVIYNLNVNIVGFLTANGRLYAKELVL